MTQADLRVLMQRMSEATQAASAAAQAAALASTSQGPRPFGVGDMTKVLPKPDPFRPSTREEEFAHRGLSGVGRSSSTCPAWIPASAVNSASIAASRHR